jgi:sporulation protein YlmC with PRC-barrel domain
MLFAASAIKGFAIAASDGQIGVVSDRSFDDKPSAEPAAGLHGHDPHLRSVFKVCGYDARASDGSIGRVEDVLVDTDDFGIKYVAVDTSDCWFDEHVLISPHSVLKIPEIDNEITINASGDQVRASPAWDKLAVPDGEYQKRLHRHHGWPGYGW